MRQNDATLSSFLSGCGKLHLAAAIRRRCSVDQDVRARLAESDRAFLAKQLALPNIEIVIVNGRSALEPLKTMGVRFEVTPIDPIEKKKRADVSLGSIGDTLICGWNFALAQPPETKVLEEVKKLLRREIARSATPYERQTS
jgi:hypothetical protein